MLEEIKKMVADYVGLQVDEVKSDASLKNTIGLDSTEIVDIATQLQKRYGKNLPIQMFKNLDSVNAICDYMQSSAC